MKITTESGFDGWCIELGESLDAIASKVRTGPSFDDGKISDVLATLRNHPAIHNALNGGGPNRDEAFYFLKPIGGALLVEMKTLALQLTGLAAKAGGLDAARMLNRFLAEGESHGLRGCEITLIWGLRSGSRIDIDEGVFLAPYEEIARIYGPHPFGHSEMSQERASSLSPARLLHREPENVTALVREFTWGPGIASISETSCGPYCRPVVRLVASDQEDIFTPPEDNERIRDFLTIATETHQLSGAQYARVDSWLTEINQTYQFSSNSYRGSWNEWCPVNVLDEDKAQLFLQMAKAWVDYKGNREQLDSAVRQLATLYSREGRSRTNDCILDAATALEAMYGVDAPEITYKLRVRAGFFLGANADKRQEVFDIVGKFYQARSAVVHGGSRKRQVDPEDALFSGVTMARDTLLALLRLGYTPKWDRMVMSAGEKLDP